MAMPPTPARYGVAEKKPANQAGFFLPAIAYDNFLV
jgi:hypothetical protein